MKHQKFLKIFKYQINAMSSTYPISALFLGAFLLLLAAPVDVPILAFDEFDLFLLPDILKWNTKYLHQKKINTHNNQR